MTPQQAAVGILAGFVAGVLSGAFGVGGGIITTPVIAVLLGGTPMQAIATPLPVILPTAIVGVRNYRRAGQLDLRAAGWTVGPGIVGAVIGAQLTEIVDAHSLLLVTAVILAWQAFRVIVGRETQERPRGSTPAWQYALTGLATGLVSGLLGVGGGIVMVPVFTVLLGMPLKRALGTSLLVMVALVIPGTIVHVWLGNIDWTIAGILVVGVTPGAWIGSKLALEANDRTLRLAVGSFMMAVAVTYGCLVLARMLGWAK